VSILVIGGGEIGQFIADKLIQEKKEVVIIEKDEHVLDEISESLDAKFVVGNGAAPQVLREAGLKNAEMVIAVTDSDEVNLLATILAGMEAPQAIRIARIRSLEFDIEETKFQEQFHINLVINPDREAARVILKILEIPGATDMLDFFDGRVRLVGANVRRTSPVINRPLRELARLREERNFLVAAIFRGGQLIIPTGDNKIMPGDNVYFMSAAKHTQEGMRLLGHKGEKAGNIMIHGGGFIGMNLAASLEKKGINVKVIEPDSKICSVLSRQLNKSVILNAAGTNQDVLEEENVSQMDAFVAVTKDDEDNILSALLAKRLGCPLAVALSHKIAYQPLISAIGIDVVINPRALTNNAILHFIRRGKVIHVSSLREDAEIIEAEALETSDLVGQPIRRLKLPAGSLVLSIKRGDKLIVPWGDTVIESGDRVLLLARRDAIPKIEKFIVVKLEYF
jgi:trk system potassium uptake protein TrkA